MITITRWDDYTTTVSFKNTSWVPIDLTGATLKMSLSTQAWRNNVVYTQAPVPSVPTSGEFDITFPNSLTTTLTPWTYYMDIEMTDSFWKVSTPHKWTVSITYDITA